MKVVSLRQTEGMAVQDYVTTTTFLTQNGGFNITNVAAAIARDLFRVLPTLEHESGKIKNVPSIDEFAAKIEAKEKIHLESECASEEDYPSISFDFDGENLSFEIGFRGGYVIDGEYKVEDIADENVRYMVVENFMGPAEYVTNVDRIYEEPKTELSEALESLAYMKHHGADNSRFELVVVDITSIFQPWYDNNMCIVDFVKEHADLLGNQYWLSEDLFDWDANKHFDNLYKHVKNIEDETTVRVIINAIADAYRTIEDKNDYRKMQNVVFNAINEKIASFDYDVHRMFPDMDTMKRSTWSNHGDSVRFDDLDMTIEVGLYYEPDHDPERSGDYTLQVFFDDDVVCCIAV